MTPWELAFTPPAEKAFAAMPTGDRAAPEGRLRQLVEGQIAGLNLKKLVGQPGTWRIRSGRWRAGFTYHTDSHTIVVSWISTRKDAYR